MTDPKPMPRGAIIAAGWIIALAAVAGLGIGVVRDLKSANGAGGDAGEVVAPVKAANAQPLTAPPVTAAEVRRWAREEMQAGLAARAPKKAEDEDAAADAGTAQPAPAAITSPLVAPTAPAGNVTAPKPPPQPAPQIPF
jgi:hypothetical protein